MRLSIPNLPDVGRIVVAVKKVRWRDPLVQVWGMIGIVLVGGMVSYYARRNETGEQKNAHGAASLLTAAAPQSSWQPGVSFDVNEAGGANTIQPPEDLDLRACAESASKRRDWRYLQGDLRAGISRKAAPAKKVVVTWSSTRGGDAGALHLYFDSVKDDAAGSREHFVIGNGKRSRDGGVEPTRRWLSAEGGAEEVRICLIGDASGATAAQKEALGELITSLEARSGTLELVLEGSPGSLLAHRD